MGFFWGAATVAIVVYVVSRRRRHHRFWAHWGFRHRHFHDEGYGPGFGRGYRRRGRFLFGLFRRLDASPGQEKALAELFERLRAQLDETLPELRAARKELAAALGGDVLDGSTLDAALQRGSALAEKLRQELRTGLASVHELLDPEQRRQLAEWIADGSFGARFRGPSAYGC